MSKSSVFPLYLGFGPNCCVIFSTNACLFFCNGFHSEIKCCILSHHFWLMDDVVMPSAFGGTRMALDHSLTDSLTRFSLIYSLKPD